MRYQCEWCEDRCDGSIHLELGPPMSMTLLYFCSEGCLDEWEFSEEDDDEMYD